MHHGNSSIKIFPDRIEFFNPGRLPDNISVDDLKQGTYVSDCRNKLIAKIFKETGWIERYGTGIRRIRDDFKEYGSPEPQFENFQHGFRVIAYPLPKEENFIKSPIETVEETVEIILNMITKNPKIKQNELAEITGLTRRGVEWNLNKLKTKGLIERIGPKKGGYWNVIGKNKK